MSSPTTVDTVVLDVDGTLVDSNYQHAIAWHRAFREVGVAVEIWRIHRAIGMGGERLVPHVAGDDVEEAHGSAVRELWERQADSLIQETQPLAGATDLLDALRSRGLKVVLATSGKPQHTEHSLDLLGARNRIDHLTTSEDVDSSKPAPDLLTTAREAVGGSEALMVGDSVWDVAAANAASMPAVGLLTGGYGREELLGAGAVLVYENLVELTYQLDQALRVAADVTS